MENSDWFAAGAVLRNKVPVAAVGNEDLNASSEKNAKSSTGPVADISNPSSSSGGREILLIPENIREFSVESNNHSSAVSDGRCQDVEMEEIGSAEGAVVVKLAVLKNASAAVTESCQNFINGRSRKIDSEKAQTDSAGREVPPKNVAVERISLPKSVSDHVSFFQTESGIGWYVCRHCRYKTREEAAMLRDHLPCHRQTDSQTDPRNEKHKCPSCSFSSNSAGIVLQHMQAVHGSVAEENKFFCRHCPFRTEFRQEFSEHTLFHVDCNRYHCSLCSFCANDQLTVLEHEAIHFAQPVRKLDGIARVTRKYQRADDKTPFFILGDISPAHPPVKWPTLTDAQKLKLKSLLEDTLDTSFFF